MALSSGARLGPYEILAAIGAGGMGEVYRARDTRLDRDVAIKVLPAHLTGDPTGLARFEREAKAIAALSHPNILALHAAGAEGSASGSRRTAGRRARPTPTSPSSGSKSFGVVTHINLVLNWLEELKQKVPVR